MRWPPLTSQDLRRRSAWQAQDLYGMGHPDPFSTGIPTSIKGDSLDKQHQGIPRFNKINTDKLEFLIGKLNHAAHIIAPSRYFLNRLHKLLKKRNTWVPRRLQSWNIHELQVWIKILQWVAETRVPINNIVFTTPTVMLWSDTFKDGVGGYNDKGMAWRWYIPPWMVWCTNTEPPGVPWFKSFNLHDYQTTGKRIPLPCLYRYLQCPRVDAQGILRLSKQVRPWNGRAMAGLDTCQ